ncbi:DUF885 domain-containing protein [Novosphingobium tardum]|uniref:DUF885 domain-containing protein n=1 Tax=Novosphingobium tardum TaxID=1538021 RepID=A0ABV8RVE3_9SPHN
MGLKTLRLRHVAHVVILLSGSMLAGCAAPAGIAGGTTAAAAPLAPQTHAIASQRLAALFEADAMAERKLSPLELVARGEASPPQDFALIYTDEMLARQRKSLGESLAALARVDRSALLPDEQISYDVFAANKREDAVFLSPKFVALTSVVPMNHFYGLHTSYPTFVSGKGGASFKTVAQYDENLARTALLPQIFDQAIARYRQGEASGVVTSKLTVRNMIGQIDALLAQPPEQSPFWGPVTALPASFSKAEKARITREYRATISDKVMPAYARLRAFLNDEYLPVAREGVGLSAMKGGDVLYRELVRSTTTLDLDPAAIHELGLKEVARIRGEMEGVKREIGFTGPLHDFFDYIRTNPRFHPRTREELSNGFAQIGKTVDAQIPRYFSTVPKTPLSITPYPAYSEKYEAGGSYDSGTADGSRPGTFYFNTYDLPSRFLTGMTTLYLHEGIPGHHFQISLAQENEKLPDFQRFGGNTAFVEGWALYAETLGYPMGLYKDPLQHWGTLDDEMLRAMRLVVDTGLHTKGWTRDQAIAYMLDNSGMGRTDATAEVERYIAIPGQALAYKIGALTIQRLRAKAENALGPRFDIRKFHEQVLVSGALPLPVLEAKIDRWIASGGT